MDCKFLIKSHTSLTPFIRSHRILRDHLTGSIMQLDTPIIMHSCEYCWELIDNLLCCMYSSFSASMHIINVTAGSLLIG